MNQTLHQNLSRCHWDAVRHKQIGLILTLLASLGPAVTPAKAQAPDAVPIIITVPPRHYIARPAPPPISAVRQSNPCITGYGDSVLPQDIGNAQLTTAANRGIEEYSKANRIPTLPVLAGCSETTAMRLLRHKRNDARAGAFLSVLTAAVTPAATRTAEDKAVMVWMTRLVTDKWIMAAGNAHIEFGNWRANPCFYAPPDGAAYDPGPSCPASPSSVRAAPIPIAFSAIGIAQAYPALRTPQGGSAAMAAAAALSEMLDTFKAGQVSALDILAPLAGTMGASLAQFSSGNPTGVAVSATRAALFPEVEASAAAQVEVNLQSAIRTAQYTTPDISAMVKTEAGIQQMFAAFIETTLFNGPDPVFPVPAKGNTAKRLTVRQVINNANITHTDVFEYRDWNWNIVSAYIDQGWFIHTPKAGGESHMDYSIRYKGADGSNWVAQMDGDEFVMSDAGGSRSYRSPGLRYIHQGTRVVALLNPRPPLFLVHTKPGAWGWGEDNGRQENRIDYIGWDGKEWSATIDTSRRGFNLRQRGDAVEYFATTLEYVTWDGVKWRAYFRADAKQFLHVRQSATQGHEDVIMNYKTWQLWNSDNLTARIQ